MSRQVRSLLVKVFQKEVDSVLERLRGFFFLYVTSLKVLPELLQFESFVLEDGPVVLM